MPLSRPQPKLQKSPAFDRALKAMNGTKPFVFVTGRAGTGKSTLLKYFRETTDLNCVYLAPTGVAALNIEGETIHSFFRFSPNITPTEARRQAKSADPELVEAIDALVIDEISMVRADLMDCIDAFLRASRRVKEPFGGVRIIVIGDLFQLPPVLRADERHVFFDRYTTPYFFSSDVMRTLLGAHPMEYIELDTVYRQKDQEFINLLNNVRDRTVTGAQLSTLNKRMGPMEVQENAVSDGALHLTTTNAAADAVNVKRLADLPGKAESFSGKREGEFTPRDMPTEETLVLKVGARVMFVRNDAEGKWVNGTLGTVTKLMNGCVQVAIDDGETLTVGPVQWTMYRTVLDNETRALDREKVGTFTQLPLKLAWAATIHKSQGKTFDRVVIDLGSGAFAAGQVYVALSRCRALSGIVLAKPVRAHHLILDEKVREFLNECT